jgi:hypothetical protein
LFLLQNLLHPKIVLEMIKSGTYKATEVDTQWTDSIKLEYLKWLDRNPAEKKISRAQLDQFMSKRTY